MSRLELAEKLHELADDGATPRHQRELLHEAADQLDDDARFFGEPEAKEGAE